MIVSVYGVVIYVFETFFFWEIRKGSLPVKYCFQWLKKLELIINIIQAINVKEEWHNKEVLIYCFSHYIISTSARVKMNYNIISQFYNKWYITKIIQLIGQISVKFQIN